MPKFLTTSLGRLALVAFFIFAVYSNVRLVIRNHQINERVKETKVETAKQELHNKKLKLLIQYYQTPSYQEVEARRRLALKKSDETVLIVKGLPDNSPDTAILSDDVYQDLNPTAPVPESNISRWWRYFFGG